MKRCPRCNRTYDAGQTFCSIDGAPLEDEQRFASPPPHAPGLYSPPTAWPGEMRPPPPYVWKSNPDIAEHLRSPSDVAAPAPQPTFPTTASRPWQTAPNKDMAVMAMIMGIVSLICFPVPFGQIALVLGLLALRKENKDSSRYGGKPFAITGAIIGGFTTLIMLAIILLMFIGVIFG
jgi:hypothetical protein